VVGDRFLVLDLLGAGGMAHVYTARQLGLDRLVALKVIHPRAARDPRERSRFHSEAAAISHLVHPNIVTVYDFGSTTDGAPYFAMELIEGETVVDAVERARYLPWHRTVGILSQICGGISEAHQRGIIHRDLKPANVMLTRRGELEDWVKVLDFGIAQRLDEPEADDPDASIVLGTPEFIAPEIATGGEADARSDIYALGVLAWYMLTGELPFSAPSIQAVLLKQVHDAPPALADVAEQKIPSGLTMLVHEMLAKSPGDRPQSMDTVAMRLAETMAGPVSGPLGGARASLGGTPAPLGHLVSGPGRATPRMPDTDLDTSSSSPPVPSGDPPPAPGSLEALYQRMVSMESFPAAARHVRDINALVESEESSANDLAHVVLQDYGLTTRLLRWVNSPWFGPFRHPVATVSRAVVLVGFEQVRRMSLGLVFFDAQTAREWSSELQDVAARAYAGGVMARTLAERMKNVPSEEAFLAAMYHPLGRQLVATCLPAEYTTIEAGIQEGIDARTAAEDVVGHDFSAIGRFVARKWGFATPIVDAMKPLSDDPLPLPDGPSEAIHVLAGFADEVCQALIDPSSSAADTRDDNLSAVADRFGDILRIGRGDIGQLIAEAARAHEEFARALELPLDPDPPARSLRGRLRALVEQQPQPTPVRPPRQTDRLTNLLDATIAELDELTEGDFPLGPVFSLVAEGFYQLVGPRRALLCVRDVKRGRMRARYRIGGWREAEVRAFSFPVGAEEDDLFATALRDGQVQVVSAARRPAVQPILPGWFTALLKPEAFALFPLRIGRYAYGMIYAEDEAGAPRLSPGAIAIAGRLIERLDAAVERKRNAHRPR
jgi:serine/threonine protein kinase